MQTTLCYQPKKHVPNKLEMHSTESNVANVLFSKMILEMRHAAENALFMEKVRINFDIETPNLHRTVLQAAEQAIKELADDNLKSLCQTLIISLKRIIKQYPPSEWQERGILVGDKYGVNCISINVLA